MSETRVWLVERSYSDKGLVTLVYATPDGKRHFRRQRSEQTLMMNPTTAATEVEAEDLDETPPEDRERYAEEATRMAEKHDPDAEV